MARRRSPDEDARLRLDIERRLKYGLPEWIDRELRFAKDLAALEAARHYSAVCCASLSEYMRRLGYRGITAAAQARLGKAILKNPALEEKVRSGTIRIECAEAIAPMISEPDLAGKTDWMAEATRRAPGSLRAEVHRRLEEVVQRETQLFLLRLYVPWKAHEDFSRAVEVASTKAKEALTHGLAFERVVNDYLDRNDPLRRATKALRELEAEKKAREGGTSDASRSKASLPFGEAGSSDKTVPPEPPVAPPAVPATTPDPSVLTPEEQRVIDGMYADYIGGGQAAADRLYADVYGSPGKRPQEAISSSAAPSPDPGTSDSGVPCAASAGAEAPDAAAVAAPDLATPERVLTEDEEDQAYWDRMKAWSADEERLRALARAILAAEVQPALEPDVDESDGDESDVDESDVDGPAGDGSADEARAKRTRTVPAPVERALWIRSGGRCEVPECGGRRFLQRCHLHGFAKGGEQTETNLLLLCTRHHKLLDKGKLRFLDWNCEGRPAFLRGTEVLLPEPRDLPPRRPPRR